MRGLKLNLSFLWLFLLGFALPVLSFAQEEPEQIQDVIGFIPILVKAFQQGQWLMVGAIITVFVTFAFRKLIMPKLRLGTGILPIISAVVGIITGVGLAVINGAEAGAATLAVLSGPLASTLWDAVLKYFLPKEV